MWIGAYDMFLSDQHTWLDGTLVASGYTTWYPANPDNGNENYMGIWVDAMTWGDWIGTENFKYICEVGLV